MNRSKQLSSSNTYGLYLNGTISDRTRRHVPKDNPTTEIVTYTVSDNGGRKLYVDEYAPDHYHEIGDYVSLPVYAKPYTRKNNAPSFNLCIQKKATSRGEHFCFLSVISLIWEYL